VRARHPAQELPTNEIILRDGRSMRLRPVRPEDATRWAVFFSRLDPQSRASLLEVEQGHGAGEEVARYAGASPSESHAYVATVGEGDQEQVVAVGSWDALPGGKAAAVALAVDAAMQSRGVGTALLEELAGAAIQVGFEQFEARATAENTGLLEMLDRSGFSVKKRLEDGIYHYIIDLTQAEQFVKEHSYREHIARATGVRHILCPRSIAVIGASRNPASIGGAIFRNLLRSNFTGAVFPVNPNASSIGGVVAYPSVADIPYHVDLAVIAVNARLVLEIVDQCAQKQVPGLVIVSAGFSEVGGEGMEREKALREKVLSNGMRLVGPNCLGVLNIDPGVSMDATFASYVPPQGNVSMGTQSGAIGLALLDHAAGIGLGVAHFVSIGNRVDVSSNDLLEFWEDDPATDVILLYLESFGNPRKFSRIARRVSRRKPVVAMRGGRSAAGARAAQSHTGALASSEVAVEALFRQTGIIRVATIEEMFDVARVVANQPLPKGDRVAIISNGGGPAILAADACDQYGLKVPPLSAETQSKLREFLPPEASTANPVDMIASATPENYKRTISVALQDPGIDAVVIIYTPVLLNSSEQLEAFEQAVLGVQAEKPVVGCILKSDGGSTKAQAGAGKRLSNFIYPENAVRALARAHEYTRFRQMPEGSEPYFTDIDFDRAAKFVNGGQGWLLPEAAMGLLDAYRIPVLETRVATSAEEAAAVAEALGFPVAMKVRSGTIIHKTDVGGVALGLDSADAVAMAYRNMIRKLEEQGLGSQAAGVVLQPMLAGGQEMILGMSQDPVFGPLMMLGFGGVMAELMKDVAFSLHPLTDLDPERMLAQLKGLPVLTGWRGSAPRDVDALKDAVLRFSVLVQDFPQIEQIEVNPLAVYEKGHGCIAVDARVMLRAPGQAGAGK